MAGMGWLASQWQEELVPAQNAEQRAATTGVAQAKENLPERRVTAQALHHPAQHLKTAPGGDVIRLKRIYNF
jgi:hypothetical protein